MGYTLNQVAVGPLPTDFGVLSPHSQSVQLCSMPWMLFGLVRTLNDNGRNSKTNTRRNTIVYVLMSSYIFITFGNMMRFTAKRLVYSILASNMVQINSILKEICTAVIFQIVIL